MKSKYFEALARLDLHTNVYGDWVDTRNKKVYPVNGFEGTSSGLKQFWNDVDKRDVVKTFDAIIVSCVDEDLQTLVSKTLPLHTAVDLRKTNQFFSTL